MPRGERDKWLRQIVVGDIKSIRTLGAGVETTGGQRTRRGGETGGGRFFFASKEKLNG